MTEAIENAICSCYDLLEKSLINNRLTNLQMTHLRKWSYISGCIS